MGGPEGTRPSDLGRSAQDPGPLDEGREDQLEGDLSAIVLFDPRGQVTFLSEGGQRMLGNAVRTSIRTYWAGGAKAFREARRRLARTGRIQAYQTRVRAANGSHLPVEVSASLTRGADGRPAGVLAVVQDVAEHRRRQLERARIERLATAGLLAAGSAHEIGNPLTCIFSLSQMLGAVSTEPAVRRGIEDIRRHAERIQRIVQDLTNVARPMPFQLSECRIEEIVESAVRLARHNSEAKSMTIEIRHEGRAAPLQVAPDHLLQVFLNIILNAAEAGGSLTITVVGTATDVRVVFADTGHGMSAEQLRRVFEPFASIKDRPGHLGLGLFVSQQIIRHHGGSITANSVVGAGSTFTVALPVGQPPRLERAPR